MRSARLGAFAAAGWSSLAVACVLDWEPPEEACSVCYRFPKYAKECAGDVAQDRYVWENGVCHAVVICACESSCDLVYASQSDCVTAHEMCAESHGSCAPTPPATPAGCEVCAEPAPPAIACSPNEEVLYYFWEGNKCQEWKRCPCPRGVSCPLYASVGACDAAHAVCKDGSCP
jgi:hypothetical protein